VERRDLDDLGERAVAVLVYPLEMAREGLLRDDGRLRPGDS